jgi:hypothetical protein
MTSKNDVSDDESPISSDTDDDEEATVVPTPPVCRIDESSIEDQPKDITFKNIKDGDAKRFLLFQFLLYELFCFQC